MEDQQILTEIKEILAKTFKVRPANVRLDSKLDDDLGLDSVDIMDSIGLFEDRFGIAIFKEDVSQAPKISTVQDLIDIVKQNKG